MSLYEVEGTYGSHHTLTTVLCYDTRHGTWYCCTGSQNVNFTYDRVEDGVDVETLADTDTFTWDVPIETLEELEAAVDD